MDTVTPDKCLACQDHQNRLADLKRQQDKCPEKLGTLHKRLDDMEREKVGFGLLKLFTGILVAVLLTMGGFTIATKVQLYALTTEVRVLAKTVEQHLQTDTLSPHAREVTP